MKTMRDLLSDMGIPESVEVEIADLSAASLEEPLIQAGIDASILVLKNVCDVEAFELPTTITSQQWLIPSVRASAANPIWSEVADLPVMPIRFDGPSNHIEVLIYPTLEAIEDLVRIMSASSMAQVRWHVIRCLWDDDFNESYGHCEWISNDFDPIDALEVARSEEDVAILMQSDRAWDFYERILHNSELYAEFLEEQMVREEVRESVVEFVDSLPSVGELLSLFMEAQEEGSLDEEDSIDEEVDPSDVDDGDVPTYETDEDQYLDELEDEQKAFDSAMEMAEGPFNPTNVVAYGIDDEDGSTGLVDEIVFVDESASQN